MKFSIRSQVKIVKERFVITSNLKYVNSKFNNELDAYGSKSTKIISNRKVTKPPRLTRIDRKIDNYACKYLYYNLYVLDHLRQKAKLAFFITCFTKIY